MDFAAIGSSLWQIVVFGLLVGAGLPALFALGLRLIAAPVDAATGTTSAATVPAASRIAGYLCFAVVLAAIAAGIVFIVSGGH